MEDYKAERQMLLQIFKGKQQNRTLETQNRTFEQQNRTFKKKNSILKCLTLSVKKQYNIFKFCSKDLGMISPMKGKGKGKTSPVIHKFRPMNWETIHLQNYERDIKIGWKKF